MPRFMGTRWGEVEKHLLPSRIGKLFLYFRSMPVACYAIGFYILIYLAVKIIHLGSPPCA